MKGFMKFLAAAKLVELSEEERQSLEAASAHDDANLFAQQADQAYSSDINQAPVAPVEQSAVQYAQEDVAEGKSFDEIFASAQISESVYPAERLLRLLDGLRAMDAATRIAAVRAMDAADDNWTIADSVLDAQRKIAALESYQKALEGQLAVQQDSVVAEIADMKLAEERAISAIKQQITELEALLAREIGKTAETIAQLEAGRQSAHQTCEREVKRLQLEIERLREIPVQFSS
ncbi:hypothetical protein [Undibacterium sp.]|uniref:hypothetical protein n=1 Tax=Undibacterium sp. TaxID=1914977 RepID=UPI0037529F71